MGVRGDVGHRAARFLERFDLLELHTDFGAADLISRKLDDAIGIAHRQLVEQHSAEDGEHRDRGSDAESQYEDRGDRERGCAAKAAKGDANVASEVEHRELPKLRLQR